MSDRAERAKALIERLTKVGEGWREQGLHESVNLDLLAAAALTASEAEVTRLETGIAEANRRWLVHIEQDREFLQQVADSYGIRRDEVTVGFLTRRAEALSQPTTDTNGAHA